MLARVEVFDEWTVTVRCSPMPTRMPTELVRRARHARCEQCIVRGLRGWRSRGSRTAVIEAARAVFLVPDPHEQVHAVLPHLFAIADDVRIDPVFDGSAFQVANPWRPVQFKRFRRKSGDDGGRRLAGAFRIQFSKAVPGPVALGHSSHFRMGLFVPVKIREPDEGDAC